jgi:hypothetical protein
VEVPPFDGGVVLWFRLYQRPRTFDNVAAPVRRRRVTGPRRLNVVVATTPSTAAVVLGVDEKP